MKRFREWYARWKELHQARVRNRRLEYAIGLANELTKVDRKTRYVIEGAVNFKIFSTDDIDHMKKRHVFKPGFNITDIYRKAVYVATYNQSIRSQWRVERMREKEKLS